MCLEALTVLTSLGSAGLAIVPLVPDVKLCWQNQVLANQGEECINWWSPLAILSICSLAILMTCLFIQLFRGAWSLSAGNFLSIVGAWECCNRVPRGQICAAPE